MTTLQSCHMKGHMPLLWLLQALLAACVVAHPSDTHVIITSGQQLAEAVIAWGASGGNLFLELDAPYISMAEVTFPALPSNKSSTPPWSNGELTLSASSKFDRVVLDAAMRPKLTPVLKGASLHLDRVAYINTCEIVLPNPPHVGGFTVSSISGGGLFTLTLLYRSMLATNVTFYMRLPDIARQVYIGYLTRAKIPQLQQLMQPLLEELPRIVTEYEAITLYASKTVMLAGAALAGQNIVGAAISDPNDPLLHTLREKGLLMEPAFCSNGSLLPLELRQARYDQRAPLLLTNNSTDFMVSLAECIAVAAAPPISVWRPVPVILLSGNVSLLPSARPLDIIQHAVVIGGPYNDMPSAAITCELDLKQDTGSLRLGPQGQLFIQHLVLTGLASSQLPNDPAFTSSLPLAAIRPPPGSNVLTGPSYLFMHNVTILLPADDFLALKAIALQREGVPVCTSPAITAHAARLSKGVQGLSLEQPRAGSDQKLTFAWFHGWGMNASQLHLAPASFIQTSLECEVQTASSLCGRLSCSRLAGVLVGTVGAVVLLLASLALFKFNRRQLSARMGLEVADKDVALTAVQSQPADNTDSYDPDGCSSTVTSGSNPASQFQAASLATSHGNNTLTLASRLSTLIDQDTTQGQVTVGDMGELEAAAQQEVMQKLQREWTLKQVAHEQLLYKAQVDKKASQLAGDVPQVHILALLARGSSGYVYKGLWRGLPVAVKTVVFRHSSGNPQETATAVMEAAVGASVGHKNLVNTYLYDIKQLYSQGTDEGGVAPGGLQISLGGEMKEHEAGVGRQPVAFKLFLVQELCDSVLSMALMKRLLHDQPPPSTDWESITAILLDVASGLQYLHSKNIIHGDLKPANIMLRVCHTTSGSLQVVAKLGDFGLSQQLVPGASHVSNFRSGTVYFAAPEVHVYSRLLPASDWYSFGVVMWECGSGLSVSVKGKDGEWLRHYQFPHFVPPYVPNPEYIKLMNMCLSKDPSKRPSDAEVITALSAMCQSRRSPAQHAHGEQAVAP